MGGHQKDTPIYGYNGLKNTKMDKTMNIARFSFNPKNG